MNHLQIAILEIGNQEIPLNSNWGVHVQKYLKSVGINFPASWCMAFVYWCVTEAKPVNGLIRTAGVLNQWNKIDPKFKFSEPKQGDIFIMDFGKGLGHTGFIELLELIDGIIWMHTIEGNASPENGGRNGIEVCRKKRKVTGCKGFIRIA